MALHCLAVARSKGLSWEFNEPMEETTRLVPVEGLKVHAKNTGIQLYTFRKELLADVRGILKQIAHLGLHK